MFNPEDKKQRMGTNAIKERKRLLARIENLFEGPLIILGFIWLILLVVELVFETNPLLERIGVVIWIIFIIDFLLKFSLAPKKVQYIKSNVLTVISLVVPALRIARVFRVVRILRFSRSLRLVKIIGSLNRGIKALSATMERRAFGYVLLLTTIVIFAGAAGMYAFEKDITGGLNDYGTALWWTTMIMTTLGSEYWPQTPEGRVLCIILSLFAFAVFGYITATIATFFLGRDAENKKAEIAGAKQIEMLQREVLEMKEILKSFEKKIRT
ncbi:ion transporter [Chryseolinea sp. H1M3-3]|uniref:ion transporter n=1 Tax=Chryseolinea sp. H1M3-3 TaxID=3034144 RepID=UPI0023EDC64B|nr:ion transporter [Chryseolinea sp. H1M3-3]